VSFTGEYVQAEGAVLNPPPVQQPSVPILVAGGGGRATLRYVAEHADACNLGAVGWAGGAFTPEDITHKLEVLDRHCGAAGRPPQTVLRTGIAMAVLGETLESARAKFAAISPERTRFFGHLPIVGTPEEMPLRVQTLVRAGFQYLIFIVWDPETLQLLGERVLPQFSAI
jgi:alkanesulfonate monooxygenase SsuD/methylene tetrahydromethanopterin reductase-like flavin-dependent oxidoreductase (luciferase family)